MQTEFAVLASATVALVIGGGFYIRHLQDRIIRLNTIMKYRTKSLDDMTETVVSLRNTVYYLQRKAREVKYSNTRSSASSPAPASASSQASVSAPYSGMDIATMHFVSSMADTGSSSCSSSYSSSDCSSSFSGGCD